MLMVFPMLINFRPAEALNMKDAKAVSLAMVLDFVALPAIAWALALLFFRDQPGLYVGMVLAGLFPTSGMTISWTGFAKGNVAAAVKMTVIGLIAASLLAPVYLAVLAGKVVPIDLMSVFQTIALVVVVPMAAGVFTRLALVRRYGKPTFKKSIVPLFPGVSSIGVLLIVFVAVGMKAKMIVGQPELLVAIAVPLVLFYALNFALSTMLGKALLPRGDAIAVVYGTVMRNLSIALGIAVAQFGPEAALVLAVAYIVQVQGAAWYVKATDRVFGPAVAEPAITTASSATVA
jgi:ACR3 family arsenite efflux pump ArsB